jgi:hypothetical protein
MTPLSNWQDSLLVPMAEPRLEEQRPRSRFLPRQWARARSQHSTLRIEAGAEVRVLGAGREAEGRQLSPEPASLCRSSLALQDLKLDTSAESEPRVRRVEATREKVHRQPQHAGGRSPRNLTWNTPLDRSAAYSFPDVLNPAESSVCERTSSIVACRLQKAGPLRRSNFWDRSHRGTSFRSSSRLPSAARQKRD